MELQRRGLIVDAQHLTAEEKRVANKEAWKIRQQEKEKGYMEHWGKPPVSRQFGKAEGNKAGDSRAATNQREFYRWAETQATQADLLAYATDETNPYARRRFVQSLMNCETLADFMALTNQTHGQPKQTLEVQELPQLNFAVFGDEVEDAEAVPVSDALPATRAAALEAVVEGGK